MIKILNSKDITPSDLRPAVASGADVSAAVAEIIAQVRARGDAALLEYGKKFDGAELSTLEVTQSEWDAAVAEVEPEFIRILERAAANIEAFHRNQIRTGFVSRGTDGAVMGQKVTPIERVGLYIPGGTAAYPSSALMNAIPAKIAGVSEIIMTTPPGKDGGIKNKYILAAAKIGGVDRVFKMGGAQAVAALAYGTESVPRVDKIVGPGNAYVAEAKRQVFGAVGIDMMAGPSDVCVVADSSADAVLAAADMLAQAEHDAAARAVLITDSRQLAHAVALEIETQLAALPRREIAGKSMEDNGLIIVADSIPQAVDIANEIAPEHLELCVENAFDYLERVKNAGSIFLGRNTPEALGDYLAGPNHTLPTLGTARFASPLGVDDFVKRSSFTYFSKDALDAVGEDVVYFAEREGLQAHGLSVSKRIRK
ncbi:MAG: histidinol dehydrogenase [Oscillospiraceae bacterium]|nr:histidinol dehydrogenase [Oscillospiraceae bacterium]